ncbi:MAG: ABC transporter substrate-binding protein [Firmicutes bacterium]|nr:ABC transporter substrate-binding protein [Bacillota bacterium]
MKNKKLILVIALVVVLAFALVLIVNNFRKGPGEDDSSAVTTGDDSAPATTKEEKPSQTSGFDFKKYQVDFIEAQDPSKSPAVALDRKDTMVIGIAEFSGIFNPFYAESAYDMYANYLMFDYLVEPDFDAKPIPGAADFEVSEDGLTYRFTLKDGVKFWDGTPATAEDIEFSYYVLSDPSYDGPIDISTAFIKGFDAYKNGNAEKIEGIKVVDEKTIEITCEQPSALAIWALSVQLVPKKVYGAEFKKGDVSKVKANVNNPMGTGQYKFVQYKEGESLTLVANDSYFKGTPKIKNVVFSVTPPGEELQRVILGETDIDMADVSPENMQQAKDAGFINIYRFPTNGYGYVGLNHNLPKYQDKKVRQALYHAINREEVVRQVYGEYASVINIPQSKVSWAYDDEGLNTYEFNLEKAAKLLDEAGWKLNANGKREKDGQIFTIKFSAMPSNPVTDILLPVMKDDYEKLGIELVIETLDFPALIDKVNSEQTDMWFMAWGLTADPDAKNIYHSQGAQNKYSYSNPEADRLIEEGIKETNIEERKAIYKELYKVLNEDVPCFWIYQRSDMWVANARIKGIEISSFREFLYNLYKCEIAQ